LNLLITGICGFVGSTIASTWRESYAGDQIVGIDNLSRSGADEAKQIGKILGPLIKRHRKN
jgi:CDP-paratose 2-epimerase